MNNLEKLKKAIIKEIPEINNGTFVTGHRLITLADVLRVIWKLTGHCEGGGINENGEISICPKGVDYDDYYCWWNLSKNNLDLQSKGTIDFLTNLICKDE